MLSREQILGTRDIQTTEVDVPEWGGSVGVKTISAAERDEFEAAFVGAEGDPKKLRNVRAKLVALCLCDADGKRLFTEPGHVAALGEKNGAVVDRLFTECRRFNGLDKTAVEEAAKN